MSLSPPTRLPSDNEDRDPQNNQHSRATKNKTTKRVTSAHISYTACCVCMMSLSYILSFLPILHRRTTKKLYIYSNVTIVLVIVNGKRRLQKASTASKTSYSHRPWPRWGKLPLSPSRSPEFRHQCQVPGLQAKKNKTKKYGDETCFHRR